MKRSESGPKSKLTFEMLQAEVGRRMADGASYNEAVADMFAPLFAPTGSPGKTVER